MKLKIIQFILLAVTINNIISAQNLSDFTGIYAVKQRCWEAVRNTWEQFTEYEVEVNYTTNDTSALEVKLVLIEPYTLGFNVKNDSMFWIYNHLFLNEDSIIQYVNGNGVIYKDSIDLNMSTANYNLVVRCDCNGKKIRDIEVGIEENNLLYKTIKLYPNPVKKQLQVLWPVLSNKIYNYYHIFNTNGQIVLENTSQLFESINVSDLPNGNYIINFYNNKTNIAAKRFVKVE